MTAFPHSVLVLTALAVAGWGLMAGPVRFEPSSSIVIEGTSNVHDWECDAERFMASASGEASAGALTALTALSVTVAPAEIDCGSGTMDKNLRKATGTAPISYRLTRAAIGSGRDGTFPITVQGRLTMHGTTRPVTVEARAEALGGKRFKVTGRVPVRMSDYGIAPPRAMMGTMRTGDDATVRFDVTLNAAD